MMNFNLVSLMSTINSRYDEYRQTSFSNVPIRINNYIIMYSMNYEVYLYNYFLFLYFTYAMLVNEFVTVVKVDFGILS